MHIIHIITRFIRGGADENTLISCNAQAAAGHQVTLVYGEETHGDILARIHSSVKKVHLKSLVRPLNPIKDTLCTVELYRLFRELRPDIVHTHTSKAGFVGRAAAKLAGVDVIIHGVHILPFLNVGKAQRTVYLAAERILASVTDAYVNVSEGMQREGIKHGVGGEAKHLVIASGMDVDAFRTATPISGQEFPEFLPAFASSWDDVEVVLMVAAFESRKRQPEFIAEFAKLAKVRPNVLLLLAGAGPIQAEIEAAAIEYEISERVKIIGFRDDIPRWISRADICVLASEREGLPRVIVQYALARRPIVATHLPGTEAIVKTGSTGFLVGTIPEMIEPMADLLADQEMRAEFSRAAGMLDLSPWGAERMAADLQNLYDRLLHEKRA